MPEFHYPLPNGAQISVTAANRDAAIPKLKAEYERLEGRGWLDQASAGLQQINQGLTAGWWDEAEALMGAAGSRLTGEERPFWDIYRDQLDSRRNTLSTAAADNPTAAVINETAGGAGLAAATAGTGTTATTLPRLAATGAGWGGLSGAGHSDTSGGTAMEQATEIAEDTAKGAAIGAVVSPAIGRAMGVKPQPKVDPRKAAAEKQRVAQRTYNNLLDDNADVPNFGDAVTDIMANAERRGIGKFGDPVIYQRLKRAQQVIKTAQQEGREVTYREVDDLIEAFSNAAKSPNETQRKAGLWARERLYDVLGDQGAVRREADALYRQGSRSDAISDAIEEARRAAGRSGVGGNTINTQRQGISKLIRDNRKTGYFSPDEIKMMNDFVEGGDLENFLRRLAGMSPTRSTIVPLLLGSLGLQGMGAGQAGAAGFGMAGLAAGASGIGYGAQKGSERIAADNIAAIQRQILTGNPGARSPAIVPRGAGVAGGHVGGQAADTDIGFNPTSLLEMLP